VARRRTVGEAGGGGGEGAEHFLCLSLYAKKGRGSGVSTAPLAALFFWLTGHILLCGAVYSMMGGPL